MTDKVASQDAVRALMELADELVDTEKCSGYYKARAALESAIRAALQEARSAALEEAINAVEESNRGIAIDCYCASAIRALDAKEN